MSQMPKPLFCSIGGEDAALSDDEIKSNLFSFLDSLGPREDVLLLPPDYTRFHSQAGKLSRFICEYYNFVSPIDKMEEEGTCTSDEPETKKQKMEAVSNDSSTGDNMKESTTASSAHSPAITILPALGTHAPMTEDQIETMFGKNLVQKEPSPFLVHDWRNDVETIGHAPASMVESATNGMVKDKQWPAQLNKVVWSKRNHDPEQQPHKSVVLSIGQVVPHEVLGMANYNKNLFVGVGGVEAINLSHFIGAVHGMENMMGRSSNPLRSILNYASEHFLQRELDLWYILTVMGTDEETGKVEMKGFYIGNDIQCYNLACDLSLKVNFTMLPRQPKKIIVHLDKDEFHSTWLGNKAIYRTRMAIADEGELIVLAPGVSQFGEDEKIDALIREYGYVGTPATLKSMKESNTLQENLSAVAHLIHGSSEGRFQIKYCPGKLSKEEIEKVGFNYGDLDATMKEYNVQSLKDGWNTISVGGVEEEIYFISNPALGLWAVQKRFDKSNHDDADGSADSVNVSSNQSASSDSGGIGGWKKAP
uniref:LarA-like N-terminal domain-containing protein n=1 Tax=Chaetoceros debilis TaxID=122233 RepID=A0A7S3V7Q6_9STRA